MNVLFASSEVWPLVKTGGLGDVAFSLPHALQDAGENVRIIMPAYREVLRSCDQMKVLGWMQSPVGYLTPSIRLIEARHEALQVPLWLIDCPELFDRPGNPYMGEDGNDWFDNGERFTQFSWAVSQIATGQVLDDWRADVVHANDWQCGLIPAFLEESAERPKRVFTIHNLAYGGHFSKKEFEGLKLPSTWWSHEGVEFFGGFSMLKAGIVYSDAVTTVSPTYANEICTTQFGYGMEGILASRRYKLTGILNGIDTAIWNPATDPYLPHHYSVDNIEPGKSQNKRALLEAHCEAVTEEMMTAPLMGMVTRLVEQKGVDMITQAIPTLIGQSNANFMLMGSGSPYFERVIQDLCNRYPSRVFCYLGYSEEMAHLVEAGSDLFLMPSRFEPCGLNQMYSLRYGTLPVVNNTGGLADTVINASDEGIESGTANGFVMYSPDTNALLSTLQHALYLYNNKKSLWKRLQQTAMQKDMGWQHSAAQYLALYR